jgi:hypothetical protein
VGKIQGTGRMGFRLRRIVTGHDENGKSKVTHDDELIAVDNKRATPGERLDVGDAFLWETHATPADAAGPTPEETPGRLGPGPGGTILRVLEFPAGLELPLHSTDSVDYLICLEGSIDMLLDDGASVHLQAGDVLIQRATAHGWRNSSGKPCRLAFMLVDARGRIPHRAHEAHR